MGYGYSPLPEIKRFGQVLAHLVVTYLQINVQEWPVCASIEPLGF
jgi:hypothetical protein